MSENKITEVVFILDKSGSMNGLESDTAGGFNSVIEEQKKKEGKVYVSAVLFNSESEVLYDRVDIENIRPMKAEDFITYGTTALIDAMGDAIHHIGNIHKYARKEDVPENTIFVIMTDGMENSSHRYSSEKVKKMVERQKSEYGWEFLFLGANIDAVETAKSYGIAEDRSVTFCSDSVGHALNYKAVSSFIGRKRRNSEEPIDASWADEIRERKIKK